MSVDPNGDSRNPRRGAEGGCRHLNCRTGTNIDRAVARSGTTGENEGYLLPADGAVVADHEVAPVEDVGAWFEVERSSARDLDSPAIDAWRNGFGLLLAQPVTGSRASGIGRNFEAGIGSSRKSLRCVGRHIPQHLRDDSRRERHRLWRALPRHHRQPRSAVTTTPPVRLRQPCGVPRRARVRSRNRKDRLTVGRQ